MNLSTNFLPFGSKPRVAHFLPRNRVLIIISIFHNLRSFIMQQNTLKTQFQEKEKELFEIHLQLNGHSRNIYEQVLRKNNEIIRNCLTKFNEVYNRIDEYQHTFQRLQQEIGKLRENSSNFHFEFRKTFLDSQKKQAQLTNDISMMKNALKIPSIDTPPEVYLQSDFFKSQANKIRARTRDNKMTSHGRSKTNYIEDWKPEIKQNEGQISSEKLLVKIREVCQVQNQDNESKQTAEMYRKESLVSVPKRSRKESRDFSNNFISKEDFESKIKQMEYKFQEKVITIENSKKECDWNHIDFDEIQRYIDEKISSSLEEKVSHTYLQTSLNNLKEAWQAEEKQIYFQLQGRATTQDLFQVHQKVYHMNETIDMLKKVNGISKASSKHINHSLNKTINLAQLSSLRTTFRDDNQQDSNAEQNLYLTKKQSNEGEECRKNLYFSNSISILRSTGKASKTKKINIENLNDYVMQKHAVSDKSWKQKVSEVLNQGRTMKKTKARS